MIFRSTVLFVTNIERSKIFYTELLNFFIVNDFGNNVVLNNGLTLWAIRPEHILPKHLDTKGKSNKFELYFESSEIEDIYTQLLGTEVRFFHPLHEEPWGQRTIRFFDPDNHLIEIGEPLIDFVRVLHQRDRKSVV